MTHQLMPDGTLQPIPGLQQVPILIEWKENHFINFAQIRSARLGFNKKMTPDGEEHHPVLEVEYIDSERKCFFHDNDAESILRLLQAIAIPVQKI